MRGSNHPASSEAGYNAGRIAPPARAVRFDFQRGFAGLLHGFQIEVEGAANHEGPMIAPLHAERRIVVGRLRSGSEIGAWSTGLSAVVLAALAITRAGAQPVGKYGELADRYGNPSSALREMMARQFAAAKNAAPNGTQNTPGRVRHARARNSGRRRFSP